MASNKEYHDFLQFLYFEGYTESYAEAEELLETLTDDEIEKLDEARRRAHSFPLKPSERRSVRNIQRMNLGDFSVPPDESVRVKSARKVKPEPEEKKPRRRTIKRSELEGIIKDDLDLVADYLFSEGFADTPESAEVMAENISDNWVNQIIEKFNPKDYEEYHRTNHRERNQSDEWDAQERDWQDSKGDIRDKHNMARNVRKKRGVK
jgi:hypothetical protein